VGKSFDRPAFTVTLQRPDDLTSKRRRVEALEERNPGWRICARRGTSQRRPPPPAVGGRGPANRELENHRYKQLVFECCLYLWFSGSLTRAARGGERLQQLRIFGSSYLRRYRGYVSAWQWRPTNAPL